ncbi:PREDICTED: DNA polymerase V-like [Dinoponera quadriceps]|uniref:DNA polymerase V-like n=1 Tax=Dinoponera quadriceps TaxID=609295 RepID=A0A6P3WXS9_DINQU|nr:PREDICTED: DNA polymerase V-like [Dinoponera quadriceps]
MNPTQLDNFNKLKNSNDVLRINAGVALSHHLYQQSMNQNGNRDLNYALTRLVRSLGSSTVFARRGFYSTLTIFLKLTHHENPIEKLLSIMNTQLHPASSNPKNENADIYMGHILLCGALMRSESLAQNTIEIQQQVVETLLNAGRQRSYLSFVSVMFLSDFIVRHLSDKSMKKVVWPIIEKQFVKPWSEQTLDTFYILLIVRDKYPSLLDHKFLKEHLGVRDIITKESMENIIKLLMSLPRIVSYHHPVVKLFCEKLISSELVADFWRIFDQKFVKPSKSEEYLAIEILRLILSKDITDKTIIPLLLSPNLLQHMLKKCSNCKNNNDEILIAFKEVLHLMIYIINDKDIDTETQLNILKRLILHPGDLMIEKKTGTKVIQVITANLKFDGVQKLCQLYRDIIEIKITRKRSDIKSELWTNAERSYAAQLLTRLMGHPETLSKQDWRLAELIFLFNYGLCEVPNVGIDLAPQLKDSFYRALDCKLPKLDDVRNLLSALVHDIDSKLRSNTIQLRSPLNDVTFDSWKRVIDLIDKLENTAKNAEALPIFHTMNLHMGLQLFSDPEVAIMSINELQCCYERFIKRSKEHNVAIEEEEPHWVEVVVDLLLSLLSRNNHLLRSLVGCVFPHICPYLTSSAVYPILAVLDIKNNYDALTVKESDTCSDTEEETDCDDIENDVSNSEVSSEVSESESDGEIFNGDETLTDRLRIAVHRALGDAATKTDEEDIDVDQMNDDEAKKLDKSLAAAFKILRVNRQIRNKKQEKTDQALTHFRVRVIDLLDIYLDTCPSMAIIVDMIVPLFSLLEFCIKDPHQKPLEHRVRSCLKKLATVKKFNDITHIDDNLLTTVLKVLIEKGERSASVYQEISDKLAECCTFLVRYMQQADLSIEGVVGIYVENLTAFFKKRDCVLPFMLFKGVLQLCWKGNWQLASALVDFAFDNSIRYFRRSQALELLLIFYNNNRLQRMNTKYEHVKIEIEMKLYNNIICTFKELCNLRANDNSQSFSCNVTDVQKKVQQKFIGLLLTLLRATYTSHVPQAWDWPKMKTILAMYTRQNILPKDVKSAYKKLEMQIGLNSSSVKDSTEMNYSINTAICNKGKESNARLQKRKKNNSKEETSFFSNGIREKKKSKQKDKQVSKGKVYESHEKVISEDLKPFNFSEMNLTDNQVNITGTLQNKDSYDDKIICSKFSQKRNHEQAMGKDGVFKRRRQDGKKCA